MGKEEEVGGEGILYCGDCRDAGCCMASVRYQVALELRWDVFVRACGMREIDVLDIVSCLILSSRRERTGRGRQSWSWARGRRERRRLETRLVG